MKKSPRSVFEIPDRSTVSFITNDTQHVYGNYRKIYLPAAIIRLVNGRNFVGEGQVHMTGGGVVGYHEARDYFHSSVDADPTLSSLQGTADDRILAVNALRSLGVKISRFRRAMPDCSQVVGLSVDQTEVTNHYYGKYFSTSSENIPNTAVDPASRLGLFRLLDEPPGLEWFVADIDTSIVTTPKLRELRNLYSS